MAGVAALGLLLQAQLVSPVLSFPEPGLDDPSAYQGYQTRFYRDATGNTVQVYLQPRGGRVVVLWANAANESVGFSVREVGGKPAALAWAADSAEVREAGGVRTLEFRLSADAARIELGWFLLGSMRVERDFQYSDLHLRPYTAPPFEVAEESVLVAALARLPDPERRRHLELLRAATVAELRSRLRPTIALTRSEGAWTVRVERPSLDGRNQLALEFRGDAGASTARVSGPTLMIASRSGAPVRFAVRVETDAAALTPLAREEIFNPAFLRFLAEAAVAGDSAGRARHRRLERQVRGVELLSSREKLMAGLPNFATYFGRDMLMTALMMRQVWSGTMAEHVIASVLRKLGPRGEVSHEEALGGQAIREHALVYDSLLRRSGRAARAGAPREADSLLRRARAVLGDLQATRENYHMVDDELQLPVLVARYLADSTVPRERRRAFLLDSTGGDGPRLAPLLKQLALVAAETRPYVDRPQAANLVSFPRKDASHWRSSSWRDSDAGYAGGRFALDVNAIWAPQALEAIGGILRALADLGVAPDRAESAVPELAGTSLGRYLRDSVELRRAQEVWWGARRHFLVRLGAAEVERQVTARLERLPPEEAEYWKETLARDGGVGDSLEFLALALDGHGRPLPVVNTDPATDLFLRHDVLPGEAVLGELAPIMRRYPVGLFVDRLGPLVANDAYASAAVWERFRADAYHSPRVVWGREVNLLLLGLAEWIAAPDPGRRRHAAAVRDALGRILEAVDASGLGHNELWSYRIEDGRLLPTRYGTSSDVQLWNSTDLAVQFALDQLPPR